MIRKLDGSGALTNNPKAVKDRWKEYFCDLLNSQSDQSIDLDDFLEDRVISWELNAPPTMDEMDKALKTLKNHKTAGDDHMISEIFCNTQSDLAKKKLLEFFTLAWETQQIPTLMCRTTLFPIYKKGDKLECSNYRGIQIESQVLKILSKILHIRIDTHCEKKKHL